MKKLIFLIMFIINIFAHTINIKAGWQLLGTENELNVTIFKNSNIKSVWSYDSKNKRWKAYIPNINIDLNKLNIENLTKIDKYEGFWLNSLSNFTLNTEILFNTLNVGFPAGGLKFTTKDNDITWINASDLILDPNIENTLFAKHIKKYNPYGFYNLHKYLKNSKFLIYWLVKNWDESWFNICLLYTSPSPRDRQKSRMPSSA
jgi:hypothetical protein